MRPLPLGHDFLLEYESSRGMTTARVMRGRLDEAPSILGSAGLARI